MNQEEPKPNKGCHSTAIILLLTFVFGSLTAFAFGVEPFEVERGKIAVAEAVAMTVPSVDPAPGPDDDEPAPGPGPGPGEQCQNCDGTGKVPSGDGLSKQDCSDCGGDGVMTGQDALRAVRSYQGYNVKPYPPGDEPDAVVQLLPESPPSAPVPLNKIRGETINWFTSLHNNPDELLRLVQDEAEKGDKPVFVFWEANFCAPCDEMKETTLKNPSVVHYLNEKFFCVKVNASNASQRLIDGWELKHVPLCCVVTPDFKDSKQLQHETDPGKFLDGLQEGAFWSRNKMRSRLVSIDSINNVSPAQFSRGECMCSVTGICTCGDDCRCPNCPVHKAKRAIQARKVMQNTGMQRTEYALYYVYPEVGYVSYGSVGGNGSVGGYGSAGGMYQAFQPGF